MKRNGLKALFLTLFLAVTLPLLAQTTTSEAEVTVPVPQKSKRQLRKEYWQSQPKVSTEFGLGVGARYNFFEAHSLSTGFAPSMSMQWSGGAALQFRLNIGRSFGFQPEISYARANLKISGTHNNNEYSTKIKSDIVQIPMLLSFRAAMFRFNFGPVFTLMDNTSYNLAQPDDNSIQKMTIGRMYPAITYTAGISVKFAKVLMLDVRYADQFPGPNMNKITNEYVWTLDKSQQAEAWKFRTRTRNIQLRFGVVF